MQEAHGDDVDVAGDRGQRTVERLDLPALRVETARHLVAQPRGTRGSGRSTNGS